MNPQFDVKNLTDLILQSVDINFTVTLQGEIIRIYAQLDPSGENTELSQFVGKSISDCTNLDLVKKIHEAIHLADQEDKPGEGLIEFSTPSGMKKVFYAIMPLENHTFFIFLTQKTNESIEHHIQLIKQLFLTLSSLATHQEGADVLVDHISKFDPTNTYGIFLFDVNGDLMLQKFSDEVNSEITAQLTKILHNPDSWQLISNGISLTKQKEDLQDGLEAENLPHYSDFGFFPILFTGNLLGCYVLLTDTPISSPTIEYIEEYARESGIILSSIRDYQVLDEQNKFFHSILDASDEILFVVTETGAPVYYSPKFIEHLQVASDTSKTENILTFIDPSQHEPFKELLHNLQLNTITTHQILITSLAGKKKNLEVHLTALQTNNHTLILAIEKKPNKTPSPLETPSLHMLEITSKLPLPLLIVNEHSFRITYANQFIHDYLHYQPDELLSRNFLDLFSPTENINLINAIKPGGLSMLESGHAWMLETKDQSSVQSRFVITPTTFENENSYIIFFRDYTVEALPHLIKESQTNYQSEPQAQILCKLFVDGVVIQVNQAYCDLVGKPIEKIIGRPLQESLFLEDYEEVFQHFSKLSIQDPVRSHRNRMLNTQGKIRWVEWTDKGIFEGEKLVEVHAYGREITEEYQKELLQISTEQRYQALVEKLPMAIYVFHVKTLFPVYISPQIVNLTGYTAQDFYNTPESMLSLFHPDDRDEMDDKFRLKINENFTGPMEFRIIHKDGRLRWLEESGSNITLPDGSHLYQGIIRDITGRRQVREKLQYYSKFERLINEIAIRLMNTTAETLSSEVQFIVDELGKFMQVDRSYIFEFDHNERTMSNTYEWCREGIPPMIEQLQNLQFSLIPWWMDQMQNNLEIVLNDITNESFDLEPEKSILVNQGIKSLLVVPLFHQGKPQGFIGFDMVDHHMHWEQESINLLRLVSSMIISTFDRFSGS